MSRYATSLKRLSHAEGGQKNGVRACIMHSRDMGSEVDYGWSGMKWNGEAGIGGGCALL